MPSDTKGLTSWKEIASYLGKSVRTVQRWETKFCLPIHRPAIHQGIVRSTKDELDRWLSTYWSSTKPESTDEVTFLRKRVAELSRENSKLKRKLAQLEIGNASRVESPNRFTMREQLRELPAENIRDWQKKSV